MSFAPWPSFEDDEIQAAVNVLKSGNVNQWTGNETTRFEEEFAQYIGVRYAVALANGSLALDIALNILNIQPGDEVIVTPRSFVASVSCVCLRGAVPVFVDVDPVSQNITLENISKAVTDQTKAVITVNLGGWPCELDKISSFCKDHHIFLIEDCAQAHGACYKDQKAGSFGDCAIFSFCQDKIMTTGGEGGMLVTDNADIWKKVWSYKDHGKSIDKTFDDNPEFGFRWLVDTFGTNCRMTEIQAAIGRVMLKKLDKWVLKRREYARLLNTNLKDVPGLRLTLTDTHTFHSYYKFYVFVRPEQLKEEWNRDRILQVLNKEGVPCNTGICPEIYKETAFENYPYRIVPNNRDGSGLSFLPVAKKLGETAMMFLIHPTLSLESVQFVIKKITEVMNTAVK